MAVVQCPECNRTFPSPAALGGHLAGHRKRQAAGKGKGNGEPATAVRPPARPACPTCGHTLPGGVRVLAARFVAEGLAEEQAIKCAALAQAALKAPGGPKGDAP